jgi:hypothetical protein
MKVAFSVASKSTYELPASFNREIGRIVVYYAHYEHFLQRLIWKLLGLSQAQGRLAVREPRAEERINLIRDLATVKKVALDSTILTSMRSLTKTVKAERDLLAHGAWTFVINTWNVEKTRGSWEDTEIENPPSGNRSIEPEILERSISQLRATTAQIQQLMQYAWALGEAIEPTPLPWPGTRIERYAGGSPRPGRKTKKHRSPPRSSSA